ncbi:MAG: 4-hydroxythreonine-4-phosphate dehydrogenase PdxA [Deltaproteobacteria bacterium]|nr:4-hydroxythreonine-4-phosphate dehydrogenase PdxA [Deltaproteobacteria bacterium]
MQTRKVPDIAWALGDPAGIGPEIVAKSLASPEMMGVCRPVVVGPVWLLKRGMQIAGVEKDITPCDPARIDDISAESIALVDEGWPFEDISMGEVSPAAGKLASQMLRAALKLAQKGHVDAVVYGPLNKEAMKLAGSSYSDELTLIASWLQETDVGEVNVVGGLFTTRVTSHVPFRDVASFLHPDRILKAIRLLHRTLVRAGVSEPVIGVAAVNPHGGEHGLFGNEEQDVIAPAVSVAKNEGINAEGPYPADTIFVRAKGGGFHGVVTMYHDQGQIAMKLMGFDKIVSVQGGLSIHVVTPSHGTAFDIAGKGIANPGAFQEAVHVAARMAGGD